MAFLNEESFLQLKLIFLILLSEGSSVVGLKKLGPGSCNFPTEFTTNLQQQKNNILQSIEDFHFRYSYCMYRKG